MTYDEAAKRNRSTRTPYLGAGLTHANAAVECPDIQLSSESLIWLTSLDR